MDAYIHFKDNTAICIILKDDEPYCYCTYSEDAIDKMWELAKLRQDIEYDDGYSYNYCIMEKHDEEIHVIELSYKFYIFPYNKLISKFSIQIISEAEISK